MHDSFMKALFQGAVTDQAVFPYPDISPTQEKRLHPVLDSVRRLMGAQVDSARLATDEEIPMALRKELADIGLFGLVIPESYGGLGLPSTSYTRVIQEVASFDASIARLLGAHQALAVTGLLAFGTPDGGVGVVAPDGAVETLGEPVCQGGGSSRPRRPTAAPRSGPAFAGFAPAGPGGFVVACANGTIAKVAGP